MTLTPEQKQTVAEWVAAGDNLYAVQKKLAELLKVSMTYMDVRFLVDDLNLQLVDAKPKADASDVSKSPPPPAQAMPAPGPEGEMPPMDAPGGAVHVTVDKMNLNPNAMATGTVTFPDGVTGKWMVDLQGRPGLTDVSQPGYRPSPADAQAFMQELSLALQP
ncbi:MAG TPA: hypothetical protein VFE25_02945 [Opitutaceae bacterium]|jgi:hypothetical protein|nr:hypothetical protein [Opitutaceae bacterium]